MVEREKISRLTWACDLSNFFNHSRNINEVPMICFILGTYRNQDKNGPHSHGRKETINIQENEIVRNITSN